MIIFLNSLVILGLVGANLVIVGILRIFFKTGSDWRMKGNFLVKWGFENVDFHLRICAVMLGNLVNIRVRQFFLRLFLLQPQLRLITIQLLFLFNQILEILLWKRISHNRLNHRFVRTWRIGWTFSNAFDFLYGNLNISGPFLSFAASIWWWNWLFCLCFQSVSWLVRLRDCEGFYQRCLSFFGHILVLIFDSILLFVKWRFLGIFEMEVILKLGKVGSILNF